MVVMCYGYDINCEGDLYIALFENKILKTGACPKNKIVGKKMSLSKKNGICMVFSQFLDKSIPPGDLQSMRSSPALQFSALLPVAECA